MDAVGTLVNAIKLTGESIYHFDRVLSTVQRGLNMMIERGNEINIFEDLGPILTLAVSPDGNYTACAGTYGVIHLLRQDGIFLKEPLTGHEGAVITIAISPDGQMDGQRRRGRYGTVMEHPGARTMAFATPPAQSERPCVQSRQSNDRGGQR